MMFKKVMFFCVCVKSNDVTIHKNHTLLYCQYEGFSWEVLSMVKPSFDAKSIIVLGVLVSVGLFIIAIVYPLGAAQWAQSYTCGLQTDALNVTTPDLDNCSWGTVYNANALMTTVDLATYPNIPVFAILVVLLSFVGLGLKALDII